MALRKVCHNWKVRLSASVELRFHEEPTFRAVNCVTKPRSGAAVNVVPVLNCPEDSNYVNPGP